MHFYQRTMRVIHNIGLVLIFLVFAIIISNVIARYAFNSPFMLADEISFYLFAYAALIGILFAYRRKGHIRVDLLISRLPEHAQRWMRVATNILEITVWLVVLWQGTRFCIDLITRTHTTHHHVMQIPLWWTAIGVPIIALLILIEIILSSLVPSITETRGKRNGSPDMPELPEEIITGE